MSTRITAAAAIAALALLLGCTQASATLSPSSAPTAPPTATPPAFTLIRGISSCTVASRSDSLVGGNLVFREHFSCTYDANDPRIDGTLEIDVITTFEPESSSAAYWNATGRLTNDDGSWTGTGRGSVVIWPDVGVVNYGDTVFEGEGAYAGLRYRELMTGSNSIANISGWIKER